VTVVVDAAEETTATAAVTEPAPNSLASWHIRAAALAVDVLPGLAVAATMTLVWFAVPSFSVWWWLSLVLFAAAILLTWANRVVRAVTGSSLGRALMGIVVVRADGSPAEPWRLLARDFAHLLDTVSVFVGWLWPLWDSRRRTFADLLLGTEVRRVDPDRRPVGVGRTAAFVVSTAAVLCVAGGGSSVVAALLPDRAAQKSREDISRNGPTMVTDMLSYDPKHMDEEFAKAQSLTTDNYRPQLVKEQQKAKQRHPVVNEYWLQESAVLSATRNTATMLLFLKGYHGDEKQVWPIAATVRVWFVRVKDGRWLVDCLNPVPGQQPGQCQK
jgi:Mce-associated membrane protein